MPIFQVLAGTYSKLSDHIWITSKIKGSPCSYVTPKKPQYSARQRRDFRNPYEFCNELQLGSPPSGLKMSTKDISLKWPSEKKIFFNTFMVTIFFWHNRCLQESICYNWCIPIDFWTASQTKWKNFSLLYQPSY